MKILKAIWRKFTSQFFRTKVARLRMILNEDLKIFPNPTFSDDGLISQHISDFMKDEKFISAYQHGVAQGGLENHPGGIQFRVYVCCWAANYASRLDGDFVECGVGKGILSKAICEYINFNSTGKSLYLFDTFSGIPTEDAANDLERKNMDFLNKTHFETDYTDIVKKSFSAFPKVKVVKGKVPNSLREVQLGKISYLSIDMNNAKAEIAAIEYLWKRLVVGAVVVLDDYAYGEEFRNQKNAWDEYAKAMNFEILTLPTGQGLIIKN